MLTPWVRRTAWKGFRGLEALTGIPGTVGGAVRMNAGAFSQEIGDPLIRVEVIDQDLKAVVRKREDIGFSYRSAPGLEDCIILKAEFQLQPDDPHKLVNHMREIVSLRRRRQPLRWPSCGSIFKRPSGDFAGRLIEEAGLKGVMRGGAQISELHANFIINRGGASARDVLELIKLVKRKVQEGSGVVLEREVVLLGFTEEELIGT